MVCAFAAEEKNNRVGTLELEKAIKRNFSGLDDFDPMKFFCSSNDSLKNCIEVGKFNRVSCNPCIIRQFNPTGDNV